MKRFFLSLSLFLLGFSGFSQSQSHLRNSGISDSRTETILLKGGTVITSYNANPEIMDILIEGDKVVSVGKNLSIKAGFRVVDASGKFIYPAFVELNSSYGLANKARQKGQDGDNPQLNPSRKAAFGNNDAIHADYSIAKEFVSQNEESSRYRKMGFGAIHIVSRDGLIRGSSALVFTLQDRSEKALLLPELAGTYSFQKGSSTQTTPNSLMGSIAVLRQAFLDADWYEKTGNQREEEDLSLKSLVQLKKKPSFFECTHVYDDLRAQKMAEEMGLQFTYFASGTEYRYLNEVKRKNLSYVVSVNFPGVPDLRDADAESKVSLEELKHWELAPYQPAWFEAKGVRFALSSSGIESVDEFFTQIRKALRAGLSSQKALQALTQTPAEMLGVQNLLGSIKPGYFANLLITSDTLFSENCSFLNLLSKGKGYPINPSLSTDIRGIYPLPGNSLDTLKIKGSLSKPIWQVYRKDSLLISSVTSSLSGSGQIEIKNKVGKEVWQFFIENEGIRIIPTEPSGQNKSFLLKKTAPFVAESAKPKPLPAVGKVWFPFVEYGMDSLPQAENLLLRGATLWTMEQTDTMPFIGDILISKGKILAVGKEIDPSQFKSTGSFKTIDAQGFHLTPGIIDEHSHIAIDRGVNESSYSLGSNVRIGDVIRPQDINIYRQLAGGVVAAQLLHGSANTIGGQSALVKLRWGVLPEEMKIQGADGFIKFALGENVKQSNWGERFNSRFPQTRMGVEQVIMDGFKRAKAYQAKLEAWKKDPSGIPVRRDLALDALVEILQSKRFITCHSYVQSEINMLMKCGDSLGFRVNTFTHILEGYKLADKMKKHGAGASTFSDWWAYKYEVMDAIPFNAALLSQYGITTAINSDDAEMGRRLNQEAAKAVRYGGLSEIQALKLVTLNPAKLLHLDKQMGSLTPGKYADLVLWTDHPLSIYAKVQTTWIEGIPYFDRKRDDLLRQKIKEEKARLLKVAEQAKKDGEKTGSNKPYVETFYHCDDLEP